MYKLCKTEQSVRRQREIENCLFDILKEKKYDEITITELCERMNIPRKAFYRYFDGTLCRQIPNVALSNASKSIARV